VCQKAIIKIKFQVNTVFSIFLILKLMSVGHPSSKPYYDQICGALHPNVSLSECEQTMFESLQKFDHFRYPQPVANPDNVFEDSYETLMYAMQHMSRNTTLGFDFQVAICNGYWSPEKSGECLSLLEDALQKLKSTSRHLDDLRIRRKRNACNYIPPVGSHYDGIPVKIAEISRPAVTSVSRSLTGSSITGIVGGTLIATTGTVATFHNTPEKEEESEEDEEEEEKLCPHKDKLDLTFENEITSSGTKQSHGAKMLSLSAQYFRNSEEQCKQSPAGSMYGCMKKAASLTDPDVGEVYVPFRAWASISNTTPRSTTGIDSCRKYVNETVWHSGLGASVIYHCGHLIPATLGEFISEMQTVTEVLFRTKIM
jgi:hypothetical protein